MQPGILRRFLFLFWSLFIVDFCVARRHGSYAGTGQWAVHVSLRTNRENDELKVETIRPSINEQQNNNSSSNNLNYNNNNSNKTTK